MGDDDEAGQFKLTKDGRVYNKGKRIYPNGDVYEGEFVESMRHGNGAMRFHTGDRYDGEFELNLYHGYGVYVWVLKVDEHDNIIPGERYDGYWKDGKFAGQGIYLMGSGDVYTGYFKAGLYEGKGTLKLKTGDSYVGSWCRGLPSGAMSISYANGDKYDGALTQGKFNGQGKYTFSNDLGWYEGGWELGKYDGQGVRFYANGTKYVGSFSEGQIEGEGMMFFVHGDQYLGSWKRGQMEGRGVYKYAFGDAYEGSFLNGMPYGEGKLLYKDGGYYLGEFRNLVHLHKHKVEGASRLPKCDGWRHGFGVRVWTNGLRYEGQWVEDKMHGTGAVTNRQGAKYEGQFYNGLKTGEAKEQFGNLLGIPFDCPLGYKHNGTGHCHYAGVYRGGMFHGHGVFTCQQGPWYKGNWNGGKRDGQGEMYYLKEGELGDLARQCISGVGSMYRAKGFAGTWEADQRNGHGVLTYTSGDTLTGHFLHGQPQGVAMYAFESTAKVDAKGKRQVRKRGARFERGYRVEWLDDKTAAMKLFRAFDGLGLE